MMTVVFEKPERYLFSAQKYFNVRCQDDWMHDPLIKQMVRDIDKTELIGPHVAKSPFLGDITPSSFSGGVKGLILVYKDPNFRAFQSTIWGDNCAEWLCRLSFITDFTFYSIHSFNFKYGTKGGVQCNVNYPLNAQNARGDKYCDANGICNYILFNDGVDDV